MFLSEPMLHNDHMSATGLFISTGNHLTSVLYRSIARSPFGADDLYDLSVHAATQNDANGITGYLTYRNSYFTQYFEGTGDAVADLYQRIKGDRRHEIEVGVVLEVAHRRFPDWSMRLIDPLWHPTATAIDAIDELLHSSGGVAHGADVVGTLCELVDQVHRNE